MLSRPRIGITPDINDLDAPETEYVIRRNYADAVLGAGGLPFILPYTDDVGIYLADVDGLLVTGGRFDIDPSLYGQTARQSYVTKPNRTACEKALIEGALERSIPVLGICNGMQLLAVCLGGQLVQDILSDVEGAFEHKPGQSAALPHHEIDISSNRIGIAERLYPVNSNHHQAVLPSEAYKEIAVASDGVIEAIEAVDRTFAVGVQWHPEYGLGELDSLVWQRFVSAAKNFHLNKPMLGRD
ncbi:gamma-glutamyl-gamma-aminobutyrate hydrolase family protein [Bradyrhizobium tunisiense]|uniref:gamma-glutamyl-gamma-aminobutyrate hydrolase family protein n=1 Tax=Bradyrhizobium tunisiense TaxID=3278709 RepID=UPI0035D8BA70